MARAADSVIARSEATKQSRLLPRRHSGLLRGACHRAALRADPLARNDELVGPLTRGQGVCPLMIESSAVLDAVQDASPANKDDGSCR